MACDLYFYVFEPNPKFHILNSGLKDKQYNTLMLISISNMNQDSFPDTLFQQCMTVDKTFLIHC